MSMDEKKKSFPLNVPEQEMEIGECSTEGEDEGEGDDEEEDEDELEDVDSIDEETEDEIVDDEDDRIDDAASMISANFTSESSPHSSLQSTVYETSVPSYNETEYPLSEEVNKKQNETTTKPSTSGSVVMSRSVTTISVAGTGEKKLAVKLKKYKEGVYSFSDRQLNDNFLLHDADADNRIKLFKEKWPGKVCAFCNLGERSQLGQGEFMRVKRQVSDNEIRKPNGTDIPNDEIVKVKDFVSNKQRKMNKTVVSLFEPVDELGAVGHLDKLNIADLTDDEGFIYIHLYCALFSRDITQNINLELDNVTHRISKSLSQLCSYCNRYGACVPCSFNNCDSVYHFPCSAASEGFQYSKTNSYICRAHVDHIPLLTAFNDVTCRSCHSLGNVVKLMMCSVCGNHYHTACIGLASLPEFRTGWQCSECRNCQVCRESNHSSKLMLCGTCDKAYHAACLRPVLTSIPKIVWKCKGCRKCSDCGSRTPGSGFSSRWHNHFTVCDSCYQQRNKGFSCPVCHKAYRTGSSKEMTQCHSCNKYVHRTCDPAADPSTYQKKGETISDNPYYCQLCKNMKRSSLKRKEGFDDSYDFNVNTSQESSVSEDLESETGDKDEKFSGGYGLGKGKPLTARKKLTLNSPKGFRSKYAGKSTSSSSYQKRNQKITEFGRKRCSKSKIRGVFGAPGLGLQRPLADSQNKSDSDNGENKIILCSANDKFVLSQDVCSMCGALGTDQEGCLIACVQCGQCYHPYCVNIKVTKVILQKGWRCLDCTVCEGCGQRNDESRLILCDDCDISYHIYCMEPKLESVPRGTWKCKWCAQCLTCGTNEPGINSSWSKNYTECGPCASRLSCPKCSQSYTDGDLIIKCDNCERWLHGSCDQIRTEQDAEKCAAEGYTCALCRPENTPPPHLAVTPSTPPACSTPKLKIRSVSPIQVSECEFNFSEPASKEESEHFVDGIYLSENGFSHLNALLNGMDANMFNLRKKKRCSLNDHGGLDQGIMDSIESVVAAGTHGESPSSSSTPIIYKEGMVVEPGEDGKPPHPPEGFNIFKNESGVMILRRKRIRKIGVGGFNARMRAVKLKEKLDEDGMEKDIGNEEASSSDSLLTVEEKPRKKKNYRKPKSKFAESYPSYIQDAFFGRELLDTSKDNSRDIESSDSESADVLPVRKITSSETVILSQDELKILEEVKAKQEELEEEAKKKEEAIKESPVIKIRNDESSSNENGSSNVFEPESSSGSLSKPANSDISNSDSISKVCQEDLFHPLLRALSEDSIPNLQMNSNDSSFPVSSCPSNPSASPDIQNLISTGSNTSPPFPNQERSVDSAVSRDLSSPTSILSSSNHSDDNETTVAHQTVTTTIPSHPSTIQYIPIIQTPISQSESSPLNVRTVHLISAAAMPSQSDSPSSSDNTTRTSTIHYQYVPTAHQNRNTIHYPPSNIQIIHSGSSLIMSSNSLIAATLQSVASSGNEGTTSTSNNNFLQIIPSSSSQNSALVRNIQVMSLPSEDNPESSTSDPNPSDSISDQNIRVLTPSEIMKTLPSLGQESFDMSTEQEKAVSSTQKPRESEDEKQWKRAQVLRQQQVSSQQQQIHDSRLQNLQRHQPPQPQSSQVRQITGNVADNSPLLYPTCPTADSKSQLQTPTTQETDTSPTVTQPSRAAPRTFPSPAKMSPHPSFHRVQNSDSFSSSGTSRPQFIVTSTAQNPHVNVRPCSENDTYTVVQSAAPDMTRQLRELLQRQQIESAPPEQQPAPTRIWVQDPSSSSLSSDSNSNQTFVEKEQLTSQVTSNSSTTAFENLQNVTSVAPTFRPPLPPPHLRPQRISVAPNQQMFIRQKVSPQMLDPARLRVFLQQQQLLQQQQRQQLQLQQQQQQPSQQQPQQQQPPQQQQQQQQQQQLQQQQQQQQQHLQQNIVSRQIFRQPLQFQQQQIQIHQQQMSQPPQPSPQQQHQIQQQQLLQQEQHRQQQQQQHLLQQQHHLQQQQQTQQNQGQMLSPQQRSPQSVNISTATLNPLMSPSTSQPKTSALHSTVEPSYSEQAQNILSGNAVKEEFPNFACKLERETSNISNRSQSLSNEKQINSQQSAAYKIDTQNEGIPESVAADLDALDRDGVVQGNIAEMTALFSEFIEDELLAEMGANFNILEYADPELDEFTSNEKTNFLNDFVNSTSDPTKIKEEEDLDSKSDIKLNEKDGIEDRSDSMNFNETLIEPKINENTDLKMENKSREENIQRDIQVQLVAKNEFVPNENTRDVSHQMMSPLQQGIVQLQRMKDGNTSHVIAVSSSAQLVQHASPAGSQSSHITSASVVIPRPPSIAPMSQLGPPLSSLQPPTSIQPDISSQSPISNELANQLPVITPPPPPPYPGPPPPYPSQLKQQLVPQQIHPLSNSSSPNVIAVSSANVIDKLVNSSHMPGEMSQLQRRPLLLQEQPLLLEDLVEQEKREQVKQNMLPSQNLNTALPLMSDLEFERLKADVLGESSQTLMPPQGQNLQAALISSSNAIQSNVKLLPAGNVFDLTQQQTWQQQSNSGLQSASMPTVQVTTSARSESSQRITPFNIQPLPPPSEPPETIVTEQDRQEKQRYEQWLEQQNLILDQQKKHYESEIAKLRKIRKSINTKLRGLRKKGNDLPERDAQELQRINTDIPSLQKLVESSRKACKQHTALIQEYKNKHPTFNYLSENVTNVTVSSTSIAAISSGVTTSTISNVMVSPQQQKMTSSVVGALSRPPSANIVTQNQVDEMLNPTTSPKTHQTTLQSPNVITTSQARPGNVRPPEQVYKYYFELNLSNVDSNTLAQRQRRSVPQRPVMYPQLNSSPRVQQFAQPASPAPPQSPMMNHSYSLHSPSHYSQPPSSPMAAPSQGRRHVSQFVHPSSSPVPSHSPQPPNSPMSMPSPRHVSQFVHPSSPAPPQSPIYSSQSQFIPHSGSPIPARSPVLIRHSPSIESFVQDSQQSDVISGMNFNQENFNGNNPNLNNNSNNNSNSNGGGNTISYINTIPIPEEFKRLGIKPGLLGGSPVWNEKPESNENDIRNEVSVTSNVDEVDNMKPGPSSKSPVGTSQFSSIDDDIDSRDSSLFPAFNSKLCLKLKSPESPSDFESNEFQACGTPKTSDDSIELPMYKDVALMESCKSEENSLEIAEFHSSIDDSEMSMVLEPGSMHLTLDSADVRSDDILSGCLVSPNFVVLNVGEEHDGIMDDTSEIGQILLLNKMEEDLNKSEGVIITDVTDLKTEEMEVKPISDSILTGKLVEEGDDTAPDSESGEDIQIKNEIFEKENDNSIENFTIVPSPANTDLKDIVEEKLDAASSLNSSTILNLPTRTTSVLQLTSSIMQTSSSKEATVTFSNNQLPVYIEDFHSYVKKPPKNSDIVVKIESDLEKDKLLFDETLIKIQNEKQHEVLEDSSEANASSDENRIVEAASCSVTSTVQCSVASSVITVKESTVVATSNSTQIKKDMSPLPVATPSSAFLPRAKPSDESQNVLLKQLLQNSSPSSITHSTMTQHITKQSLSTSPTYRSPPRSVVAEIPVSTTSHSAAETVATPTSATARFKSEEIALSEETIIAAPSSISVETTMAGGLSSKSLQVSNPSTIVTASSSHRSQCYPSNSTSSSTPLIKLENTSTLARKDITQTVSTSLIHASASSSATSPMHIEIKKESISDELSSPQPRLVDAGDTPNSVSGDSSHSVQLDAQDIKKLKRRQYQAKRRQSQSKEHSSALPKKRVRKASKVEEDYSYDSFVDSLMAHLRQLPPLPITEPLLTHNYAVCLPLGSGDATKISSKTWVSGELSGRYGSLTLPGQSDFYHTEPFGDDEPLKPSAIPPTTRGFYNEEFSPLNLEAEYEERRLELARIERETESPDSVMSSSSPECIIPHTPVRFAGLRLIDENGSGVDSEEDEKLLRRISPVIPLVVPLALRPRVNYQSETNKENCGKYSPHSAKSRHSPSIPLRDSGNLSVTLTLSSEAAQDIVGVLKNLATVLNIPPPASYKITDRIPSPNKINPFGSKYNDDVEEAELQKYFTDPYKCCYHCKTQISDFSSVRKKASEVPFVVQDGLSEDLLFCSTSCYLQMLLLVPPVISEPKVSSSDEASSEPSPCKKPKLDNTSDFNESHETDATDKCSDLSAISNSTDISRTNADVVSKGETVANAEKKSKKGIKYRTWSSNAVPPPVQKFKRPTEKEMTETLFRMSITVTPTKMPEDMRVCVFCHQVGDGVSDGPSRLLNYDVDKWAHLNCSLWSNGVYETVNGALMDFNTALQQGLNVNCTYCHKNGATLKCYKNRCSSVYHLSCAMKDECVFLKDKRFFCNIHVPKGDEDSQLTTLAVYRRVYVDRDENRQIASIVQHAELTHLMRIGSLIFLNVGQLLPHQLTEFHTANYIYPVGYKVIRFYWSMRVFNKRCLYICSIHDVAGRPEFRILVQEPGQDDLELRGSSPKDVWTRVLEPLTNLRRSHNSVQIYPRYVTGEDLFGLAEPAIVRILENLPGIETLSDYRFKYGKNPLLELPLAVNPSGCARGEPKVRGPTYKRAFTQRTSSIMPRPVLTSSPMFSGDISCPYSKHFVHSKSSQYKKMKQEWRNYVYLARSKIQGLGLYAARDIDKHTMVIEYIGEIIRSQLSDFREKQYEAKNRGVYMFRLDENRVVDATICGGLARYINHSCNPNCVTEKVEVDREFRIIIFSKRKIVRGEELSYDYQFDIEDDSHKIPCLCGASNCRKWMN